MDWIDKITEFAKVMTRKEFETILGLTDLTCENCGNCCILPDLKYLSKPPGERCIHLTRSKRCRIHREKPRPCVEFPYMTRFDWVVGFKLAPPRLAVKFCGIVRKFWLEAHMYLKVKKANEVCPMCDTCQVCDTCEVRG